MSRFSHLVGAPQVSPMMPGQYTRTAEYGWQAAAGSASAAAATENAADIQVQVESQHQAPAPSPEAESPLVVSGSGVGSNGNTASNSTNHVGTAPEQPGRIAKKRSRPF